MKSETLNWLSYADENLAVAALALESGYYNSCLQNVQQSVEKALKAVIVEDGLKFEKTHSIDDLRNTLQAAHRAVAITDDECDLLDSIYLPSKYPLGSALPNFEPDGDVCVQCMDIAGRVRKSVERILHPKQHG